MTAPIVAFLPCRSGSQRVIRKNTRPFAGFDGGLIKIKIIQLLECPDIDRIVVSTDDEKVVDIVNKVAQEQSREIEIIDRPPHLATSETSTDDLIQYVPEIIKNGVVLWTHVTSPFVRSELYSMAIQAYFKSVNDSVMSVTKLQSFVWNNEGPVNYDKSKEKWPRTQTLPKWFEVNSAFFIADISTYLNLKDRIGDNPYLYELTGIETIDIDWESDFLLAENIWTSCHSNNNSSLLI